MKTLKIPTLIANGLPNEFFVKEQSSTSGETIFQVSSSDLNKFKNQRNLGAWFLLHIYGDSLDGAGREMLEDTFALHFGDKYPFFAAEFSTHRTNVTSWCTDYTPWSHIMANEGLTLNQLLDTQPQWHEEIRTFLRFFPKSKWFLQYGWDAMLPHVVWDCLEYMNTFDKDAFYLYVSTTIIESLHFGKHGMAIS